MSKIGIALVLLFTLSTVHAANWVEAASGDGLKGYVDTDSLRRTGSKAKAWVWWKYEALEPIPNSYPPKSFMSAKSLTVFDCKARSRHEIQVVLFDETGNSFEDRSAPDDPRLYREPIPDSLGEYVLKFACSVRPKTKK